MSETLLRETVGQLVAERPSRSKVFESLGIDYCCGGKIPLESVCAAKGLNRETVVRDLLNNDALQDSAAETDWTVGPLTELVDHIVETHHAYLREALPRLTRLTEKVRDAHGRNHPELVELAATYANFRAEMEAHTFKEEQILFPYIRQLALAERLPKFHCGSVRNPIAVMEREHESAGAALRQMRDLTGGFTPPSGACNTYRAMLDALAELEADTHRHVHKENSILFPRAAAREADLAANE